MNFGQHLLAASRAQAYPSSPDDQISPSSLLVSDAMTLVCNPNHQRYLYCLTFRDYQKELASFFREV